MRLLILVALLLPFVLLCWTIFTLAQEPLNAPFLNHDGLFSTGFSRGKTPLRIKSGRRPIKVGKRPIKEGKRPIKAMVLVGISVGCLMGCFRAPPLWRKTAPLKRPIKKSMISGHSSRAPFACCFRKLFGVHSRSFSENSRRLWLSEIRCWRSFPANFDAAGKLFPDFSAAQNAIPCQGLGIFRQGKWPLENRPRLWERCWIFSETATASLSSPDFCTTRTSPCAPAEARR